MNLPTENSCKWKFDLKSEIKFPFNKFKNDNWDIEHVRSLTDINIEKGDKKKWIEHVLKYFVGIDNNEELNDEIKNNFYENEKDEEIKNTCRSLICLKEGKDIEEEFEDIYKLLQNYFSESKVENINSISNLALLDSGTNRSYGNIFFPIKRKRIIENDKSAIFVPIATKNLFLKYYSKKPNNLKCWTNDDAEDYLSAIKNKLSKFLPKEVNNG